MPTTAAVAARTTSSGPATTAPAVALPSGIVSGNLLLVVVATSANTNIAWPVGWTEIRQVDFSGSALSVGTRIADGSEGATVTLTTDSDPWASSALRITTPGTVYVSTGSTSNPPNPDSLTPAGGSQEYLWIAVGANIDSGGDTANAAPSNYSNLNGAIDTSGTDIAAYTAERTLTASSENPGAFGTTGTMLSAGACTVAVAPGATAFVLAADPGSYSVTGQTANLEKHSEVAADSGLYAVTGTAANLEKHSVLSADAGSYVVTGQDAELHRGWFVTADGGVYSITGTSANLEVSYRLDAEGGSYVITGSAADLEHNEEVMGESGSYAITGFPAILKYTVIFEREFPSYVLENRDEYPTGAKVDLSTKVLTKGV